MSEQMKKVFRELLRTRRVFDPLVIELNSNQYWNTEGRGLTCMWLLKVDKELFDEGEPYFPNPHIYEKVKHLTLKVKHAKVTDTLYTSRKI